MPFFRLWSGRGACRKIDFSSDHPELPPKVLAGAIARSPKVLLTERVANRYLKLMTRSVTCTTTFSPSDLSELIKKDEKKGHKRRRARMDQYKLPEKFDMIESPIHKQHWATLIKIISEYKAVKKAMKEINPELFLKKSPPQRWLSALTEDDPCQLAKYDGQDNNTVAIDSSEPEEIESTRRAPAAVAAGAAVAAASGEDDFDLPNLNNNNNNIEEPVPQGPPPPLIVGSPANEVVTVTDFVKILKQPDTLAVSSATFINKSGSQFKRAHGSIYRRHQVRRLLNYKDTKFWSRFVSRGDDDNIMVAREKLKRKLSKQKSNSIKFGFGSNLDSESDEEIEQPSYSQWAGGGVPKSWADGRAYISRDYLAYNSNMTKNIKRKIKRLASGLSLRAIYRLNNIRPNMISFVDSITKCQLSSASICKIPFPTSPSAVDAITCDGDFEQRNDEGTTTITTTTTTTTKPDTTKPENILLFVGNSYRITRLIEELDDDDDDDDDDFRSSFRCMLMMFDFIKTLVPNMAIKFGKDSHKVTTQGFCQSSLKRLVHPEGELSRFYLSKYEADQYNNEQKQRKQQQQQQQEEMMEEGQQEEEEEEEEEEEGGFITLPPLTRHLTIRDSSRMVYSEGLTKDKCKCCCCNTYRIRHPDMDASKSHHKMSWFKTARDHVVKKYPKANIVVLFFEDALDTIHQYESQTDDGLNASFFKKYASVQNMHILRLLYTDDENLSSAEKQQRLIKALDYGRKEMHGNLNQETMIHTTRDLYIKLFELYGLYGINYWLTEEAETSFDRSLLKNMLTFKAAAKERGKKFDENLLDRRDIFDNDTNILKDDGETKRIANYLRETNHLHFKSLLIAMEETKYKTHSANAMYQRSMNTTGGTSGDKYIPKNAALLTTEEYLFNNTPGSIYRERWQLGTVGYASVRPICYGKHRILPSVLKNVNCLEVVVHECSPEMITRRKLRNEKEMQQYNQKLQEYEQMLNSDCGDSEAPIRPPLTIFKNCSHGCDNASCVSYFVKDRLEFARSSLNIWNLDVMFKERLDMMERKYALGPIRNLFLKLFPVRSRGSETISSCAEFCMLMHHPMIGAALRYIKKSEQKHLLSPVKHVLRRPREVYSTGLMYVDDRKTKQEQITHRNFAAYSTISDVFRSNNLFSERGNIMSSVDFVYVARIKYRDKDNDHNLNKFVTESYRTSRDDTDLKKFTKQFRYGNAPVNTTMNTNSVLRNDNVPYFPVEQATVDFAKANFKDFLKKPNSTTYTNDDLAKNDFMVQVETHRHFMYYGSDYLTLELGLMVLGSILVTVVKDPQVVNDVEKEMQRELKETTSNYGYYAERRGLIMITLKKPIEILGEEDISLGELELFLGQLLSLIVPNVILCEDRERLVILCLQILANETVIDALLFKLAKLYMSKLKVGDVLKNLLFEKEVKPGQMIGRTATPTSTATPIKSKTMSMMKPSCFLVTGKNLDQNQLKEDLSFAHPGCKFNIIMDDSTKDDMERISTETRHQFDRLSGSKLLNEFIVYVSKSPIVALSYLESRDMKFQKGNSAERVIGVVLYESEVVEGEINGEPLSKLLDTYPTYIIRRTDLLDFPVPKILPRIRGIFFKNLVTRNLLQHFMQNNMSYFDKGHFLSMMHAKLKSLGGVGLVNVMSIEDAATNLLQIPKSSIDNFMMKSSTATDCVDCKKAMAAKLKKKKARESSKKNKRRSTRVCQLDNMGYYFDTSQRLALFELWMNLCTNHTTNPKINIKKEINYKPLYPKPPRRDVVCEHEASLQKSMDNLIKECVEKQTVKSTRMKESYKPDPWWSMKNMLKPVERTAGKECQLPACLEEKKNCGNA